MIRLSWEWDPRVFGECVRLMAQIKEVPVAKVLRNAARDFAHGAYRATGTAAVSRSPFLQVPDKRGGKYGRAYMERAARASAAGEALLAPGTYLRGAMRWIRKTPARRPGSRGGHTPNPPYPVAKGFARASWIGVFRGLGMTTQRPARNVPASAVRIGQVESLAEGGQPALEIVDRLSYIARLDARDGVTAAGLRLAQQTMERELDREARRLERLFA